MFAGNAQSLPTWSHVRLSPLGKAPGFTWKHQTRMRKFARGKHSILLRAFANYGRKKFYNKGRWSSNF